MDNGLAARRPFFALADHVRACAMSDQVVLLDLRRSRYLALSLRQWEVLNGARNREAVGQHDARHAGRVSDVERLAAPLLRQRILTRATARRQEDDATRLTESSLDVRGVMPFAAVGVGRTGRFVAAACRAAAALRLRSLSFSVERVARRAGRLHHPQADDQRLLDAVAAFEALRPLLFTARDKCLYDSLALVTFLAGEGLAARWVIGVKTRPFAAHSWVQVGTTVLNDLHEHVRSYKPILVV